jgi:undecaprenyl diphosphate synthase
MIEIKDQIDRKRLPVHVAVIMDGNGRWAKKRGFIRTLGHEKGVDAVRNTVEAAAELGVRFLTMYAFSTENWNRPKYEIDALMKILVNSLQKEMKTLMNNNVKLHAIGDLKSLPPKSYRELMKSIRETENNTGLTLILALSYSSRWELVEVARSIARKVASKELLPDQIDISTFTSFLATSAFPDPELLIRTSGEFRISNFLLWQVAYAEFYFTNTLWPDFGKDDFYKAILDFQGRERRFGLTSEQINEFEGKLRK